jgi:serine phosphatase RsbU (regulator of sigma subunit)
VVSRGVVEGRSRDDKPEEAEFGLERVKELLRSDTSTTAQALSASILNAVGEFTREPLVPDDMTALVLMRDA